MGEVAQGSRAGVARLATDTAAAVAAGVVFGAYGFARAGSSGFLDVVFSSLAHYQALTAAVVAVVLVLTVTIARMGGWLVTTAGLVVVLAASLVAGVIGLRADPEDLSPALMLTDLIGAAGVGTAAGGALLAVARSTGTARTLVIAGFATGFVLYPIVAELDEDVSEAALPALLSGTSLLVVAIAATGAAALNSRRGASGGTAPTGRRTFASAVVVAVAATLVVTGMVLRRAVLGHVRLDAAGLVRPPWDAASDLVHHSLIAVAAVVGLLLTGYAYRRGGSVAARWVALGVAVSGVALIGVRPALSPPWTAVGAVIAVAVAVAAGVALAGRADRLFPWDALGVCLAIAGSLVSAGPLNRQFDPDDVVHPVLVAVGLGLALGYGLARVVERGEPSVVAEPMPAAKPAPAAESPPWS
ncbi:MAG TPA: hypothetical protein VFR67_08595, partial [Pilimelia sp.]|nr:hypothetical protein [Pilimelia sp.]